MFNLIITIISIGIFAVFLAAGNSYFDSDKIISIREKGKIDAGIAKVSTAITTYVLGKDEMPHSFSDIVPTYMNYPVLPQGLAWRSLSIEPLSGDISVCFGGIIDHSVYMALIDSKRDAGEDDFIIGNDCGDKTDAAFDGKQNQYPVAVTYTIR